MCVSYVMCGMLAALLHFNLCCLVKVIIIIRVIIISGVFNVHMQHMGTQLVHSDLLF